GHHFARVVGDRGPRPPLRAVHDERRAREALAHALRPDAVLPRSRVDARARRGAPRVPAAAPPSRRVRRPERRRRAPRARPQLRDPALEVVDPLRVPGQPAHAHPVPRRGHAVGQQRRRRGTRDPRQRLGRGLQPKRRDRLPGGRHSQGPAGRVHDVPRQGQAPERPAHRARGKARRHRQLGHADRDEADSLHRRLRAAQLRLQLLRAHRLPAGRDRRAAKARGGGALPVKVRAQVGMVMALDKCIGCHTCSVTCKQLWTNRPGAEYMWWNDVETKPGLGYPRRWEDQERWRGGWTLDRKGRLQLKAGGRIKKLLTIFSNPDLPQIDDYYEPCTYDYEQLITAPLSSHDPVARSRSQLTGRELREIRWGPNWDDNLAGTPEWIHEDPLVEGIQEQVKATYEQAFMFYLPRICEHCLNPSCVASCPSGAMYKREEDGIVLVDQAKC